jgi:hypothetical protein
MFRRLFAAVLAAGLLLLIGAPAYAQPPVTTTNTEKNLVETFIDVVPSCEGGPPYTLTTTSNLVEHETVFADGRVHATFTQTGTAVGGAVGRPESADLHRQVHGLGKLQRQRPNGERHLHVQRPWDTFGRFDVQQPRERPLQRPARRHGHVSAGVPLDASEHLSTLDGWLGRCSTLLTAR